jgi:hypothetical protein
MSRVNQKDTFPTIAVRHGLKVPLIIVPTGSDLVHEGCSTVNYLSNMADAYHHMTSTRIYMIGTIL